MKLVLNLFLFVLASTTLYSTPLHGSIPGTPQQVSWQDVQTYIDTYATGVDPAAMATLKGEVDGGQITWVLFQSMGGGGLTPAAPLNGPGIGWPAAGKVILFATPLQAATAAALVVAATASSPVIEEAPNCS